MNVKTIRGLLLLILGMTLIKGLIYSIVIPFDRAPDEDFYFRQIKAKQLQLNQASDAEKQQVAVEAERTWYSLVNWGNTRERPLKDFAHAKLPGAPSSFKPYVGNNDIYYLVMAQVLNVLNLDSIRTEIYLARGFSILLGVGIVFLAFLVARELFLNTPFLLIGIPLFIALIPQFSAMNGSCNSDKLAEFLASLFFWLMVKVCKYGMKVHLVTGAFLIMGATVLSKRTTTFVLPLLVLVVFVYFWKWTIGIRMHLVLFVSGAILVLGGYALLWNEWFYTLVSENIIWLPPVEDLKNYLFRPELFTLDSVKFYAKFFILLHWSFWGLFGYMTIHLHHFWYIGAALFQGVAIFGLMKSIVRVRHKRIMPERWVAKTLYLMAVSIVLVVAIMFIRSVLLRDVPFLGQGRRLFVVIIPISVLTMLGLENVFPPKYQKALECLMIVGFTILDVVCLSNYLLLHFYGIAFF
ncbi:hypothetical protein CSA56_07430 [candidate division KSB3 bacterium]|uniref:Glycosyltransferase RgtA/B/C/D-like domain-containing protein n=1 Tax=candidate division KSB3 bacterium TaxID=2044937 RepID=A0A2G6KFU9_9BACT|nr:MAG: hypothetical protein CSA56_07430 [candidate division KSB3 bacterium]